MVFIKKVKSGSKTYYYLVQSYRVNNNVYQKMIKRLTASEAHNPGFIEDFLDQNPGFRRSGIRAIIPAAGKSARLFPHSQDLPKGLVPVGEKTILRRTIDSLQACGIGEIILITGFQENKIRDQLKNEVKYIHNPFFTVSNVLASVWFACPEMKGPLLILYSDLLFDTNFLNTLLLDDNDISLAITSSIIDREAEKVVVKDGYILEISKDIPISQTDYEFAGIAKFSETGALILRETLEEMAREEGFLDLYFTAAIERLILKGHNINTIIISSDQWIDIDFPKDLQRANSEILPRLI